MTTRRSNWRRATRLFAGAVLAAAVSLAASASRNGDRVDWWRHPDRVRRRQQQHDHDQPRRCGEILVNGGAVAVTGGLPTVAGTALIQVFGQAGNDAISLNEASGALPRRTSSAVPAAAPSRAALAPIGCSARRATTRCSAVGASTSSRAGPG